MLILLLILLPLMLLVVEHHCRTLSISLLRLGTTADVGGDYYKTAGCNIVCDPDQDHNDLDKSLGAVLNNTRRQLLPIATIKLVAYSRVRSLWWPIRSRNGMYPSLYKWSHQFDYNMWCTDDQNRLLAASPPIK
jgi:hypothetical protein